MRRAAALVCAALAAAAAATTTAAEDATGAGARHMVVGTSTDYPPFSASLREGFDLDIARAFAVASDRSLEVRRFRWPELLADLRLGRFDVAMSGVTVRPDRLIAGAMSVAVAETEAVAVTASTGIVSLPDLDDRYRSVMVNAGGHLEQVARHNLRQARIVAVPDNDAVLMALMDRSVDAVITDSIEAEHWKTLVPEARVLGSLSHDRKAYLLRPDRPELAAELDRWLMAGEAQGLLLDLRMKHLGAAHTRPTAVPLRALLSAMDARLSLMPVVAACKIGKDELVDPDRERAVEDAAVAAVVAEARQVGIPGPPAEAVRAFLRAQMEAAKDIQRAQLARTPGRHQLELAAKYDLGRDLRPALDRIGAQIARALVATLAARNDAGPTRALVAKTAEITLISAALTPQRYGELIAATADLVAVD
jgi:cyclohexadienyl dehydratase